MAVTNDSFLTKIAPRVRGHELVFRKISLHSLMELPDISTGGNVGVGVRRHTHDSLYLLMAPASLDQGNITEYQFKHECQTSLQYGINGAVPLSYAVHVKIGGTNLKLLCLKLLY